MNKESILRFFGREPNQYLLPNGLTEFQRQLSRKGREALQSALEFYPNQSESQEENPEFFKKIHLMSDAIDRDRLKVWTTEDLGISQTLRLRMFLESFENGNSDSGNLSGEWPQIGNKEIFGGFPTIGAEFHIKKNDPKYDNFWERLLILNMSQYQKDSKVPLSKAEDDIIEVRMNPSIYPIAVSTWMLTKRVLPEIQSCYFTLTLGQKDNNFSLENDSQLSLIKSLQTLANLAYVSFWDHIGGEDLPWILPFGGFYIGQTVRVKDGTFSLTGNATESEGQLNLYSGFGDIFPKLAFYLSMAFADQRIADFVGKYVGKGLNIQKAAEINDSEVTLIWNTINNLIYKDRVLLAASNKGQAVIDSSTAW